MARLGDVIEQIRGVSYKPSDLNDNLSDDSVVLLRANNIQDGKIVLDDVVYVSKSKVSESQFLRQGDILVCTSSGSKELVGKAAFIDEDLPMVFGAFCKVVRPKIECCKYVGHFFQSPYYRNYISAASAGANINNLRNEHIADLHIPLPSLEEQRKIAAVLDKVSDLIAKRRTQLDKLDELVKSRFIEMFGDPVTNSFNLPLSSLSQLGKFGRGVSKHRPRNAPELLGGKYPLIQTGEVANSDLYILSYQNTYSELGFKQSKMWKAGTLCITIAANIAKTAILTFDACFPDSVVGFSANDKTNNIFIHYWFSFFQQILESQAPESAQKNINLQILSDLKIIVPPIELQNQFADFVKQTDKSKYFGMNGIKLLWKLNDIFLGAICE